MGIPLSRDMLAAKVGQHPSEMSRREKINHDHPPYTTNWPLLFSGRRVAQRVIRSPPLWHRGLQSRIAAGSEIEESMTKDNVWWLVGGRTTSSFRCKGPISTRAAFLGKGHLARARPRCHYDQNISHLLGPLQTKSLIYPQSTG